MAHPLKVRIICDAQLKNDKVDAMQLAQLLRRDRVPRVHAASPEFCDAKEIAQNLEMLAALQKRIADLEKQLEALCRGNKDRVLLKSRQTLSE